MIPIIKYKGLINGDYILEKSGLCYIGIIENGKYIRLLKNIRWADSAMIFSFIDDPCIKIFKLTEEEVMEHLVKELI